MYLVDFEVLGIGDYVASVNIDMIVFFLDKNIRCQALLCERDRLTLYRS